MAIFSHSKLQTFKQCPYKYKLKYIYKIKPDIPKSVEAHLGTSVHNALEWLYLEILNKSKIPKLDDLITKYIEKWNDDFSKDIIIVKEGKKHSDYFNSGIKFIIDYYVKNQPFKDKTLETEKKIWITLEKNSPHKIIGYIDRLVYNPETEEYEIHDYKTSSWLPDQKKLDKDSQLALYAIGIKQLFGPKKKIKLIWHYLAHNKSVSSKRTDEELENLRKETIKLIDKIESNKDWNTNKMILCNWCEYKNICKAHNNNLPKEFQQKENQKKLF